MCGAPHAALLTHGCLCMHRATARCVGPTGVEMEALTAAAVAALTVYDMCKAVEKGIIVTDVRLEAKAGGRSGGYVRPPS